MTRNAIRALLTIAAAAAATLLLGASPATAHPMPHSVVVLDVHRDTVNAQLSIPTEDLALASGIDLTTLPAAELGSKETALQAYLAAHTRPTTTDGRAWTVAFGAMSLAQGDQTDSGEYRKLVVNAVLTPPAGGDVRHFTLRYDAVVSQVVTHTVLVSVRRDWSAGRVDGDTAQVGTIQINARSMTVAPLTVDLGGGSAWRGFVAMLELGGQHILEGTDHLLFLLSLLLPAPLLAVGGRWRGVVGPRTAVRRIGLITLAFTCGHSVALAVSALSRVRFPDQPVEVFIAASILVSAVHAIRPLFPGREGLVAAVFGLGHGMAFSLVLSELNLSTGQLVLSLFGFNIGIELVQLFLVALTLPALLVLARLRIQPILRTIGAALTALAAGGWLLARLGVANRVARAADSAGTHTTVLLAGLAATALAAGVAVLVNRVRRRTSLESDRMPDLLDV